MMRATPDLVAPPQTSTPNQLKDVWPMTRINAHQAHIHCKSSVESDFETGILRPRNRDLTTRSSRPGIAPEDCEYGLWNHFLQKALLGSS
ncbi:hypothetical protein AVEN_26341-1 [Araneus ventricosus]|uniref:Uncharacterized protein n=1 Tax=Araneus ventricosus TaxID=182803 RepID=A0A4Y2ANW0_ARAVE|nr:hypothetical protein AVEN_26341-1 [Araneus ventricosus]